MILINTWHILFPAVSLLFYSRESDDFLDAIALTQYSEDNLGILPAQERGIRDTVEW